MSFANIRKPKIVISAIIICDSLLFFLKHRFVIYIIGSILCIIFRKGKQKILVFSIHTTYFMMFTVILAKIQNSKYVYILGIGSNVISNNFVATHIFKKKKIKINSDGKKINGFCKDEYEISSELDDEEEDCDEEQMDDDEIRTSSKDKGKTEYNFIDNSSENNGEKETNVEERKHDTSKYKKKLKDSIEKVIF
ncbi:hypothetical protein EDEG_01344 [Edhazardia aedis USNM 41457]|uniref:Uncharacterized protein n=1 Tax=Edhazardia aedis (strain USNM 41457) TaxID=1003232 RepID=J9DAE1_EDHAE|nr:hypothetical protein EDEG_01344 [Edhazardia aedis USNM 41457]|eukprot:EJW04474.1 hypothetical protein EDEG_01344 [Edhazardia aedis USNM 41457]